MIRRTVLAVALVSVFVLLVGRSPTAQACACCSDYGQRRARTSPLGQFQAELLASLRFKPHAFVASSPMYLAYNKGIARITRRYALRFSSRLGRWTFHLRSSKGDTGTLAFDLPPTFYRFAVDPMTKPSNQPNLYKEWRLTVRPVGTGVFAAGARGAKARFIIHSRGNSCDNASEFYAWTLIVKGPAARYRLIGRFGESRDKVRVARASLMRDTVGGGLGYQVVRRRLDWSEPLLRACYQRRGLAAQATLYGSVTVKLAIGADGKVTRATKQGATLRHAATVRCVVTALGKARFPRAKRASVATLTYEFAPK